MSSRASCTECRTNCFFVTLPSSHDDLSSDHVFREVTFFSLSSSPSLFSDDFFKDDLSSCIWPLGLVVLLLPAFSASSSRSPADGSDSRGSDGEDSRGSPQLSQKAVCVMVFSSFMLFFAFAMLYRFSSLMRGPLILPCTDDPR